MKRIWFFMIFILFVIGICGAKANFSQEMTLLGRIIYLDPGHGGMDSGAYYKDISEKDINLEISKKLQKELMSLGAIVYMTREGDYDLSVPNTINRKRSDLSRRGNIINESKCDLFLSIHLNADTSGAWRGPQIFYDDNVAVNKTIAEIFQKKLNEKLKGNRDFKLVNDLYLQKRITRPGVLVEVGFLSNASDRYLLKQETYQQKVAEILKEATLQYFSQK